MNNQKRYALLFLVIFAIGALSYLLLIPSFETTEFNPDEIIEIPEDEILTSNTVNSSNTDQKDQDKT